MGIKKSFTFIEVIVVISIIGLIIPAIFSVIFGLVREQLKVYRLSVVKKQGDFILNNFSTLIKNDAKTIHSANPPSDANEQCAAANSNYTSTNGLYFLDPDNNWFGLTLSSGQISSSSASTNVNYNSSQTIVSGMTMTCQKSGLYSAPIITLDFDICYETTTGVCSSTRPEDTATLHYETTIQLQSF